MQHTTQLTTQTETFGHISRRVQEINTVPEPKALAAASEMDCSGYCSYYRERNGLFMLLLCCSRETVWKCLIVFPSLSLSLSLSLSFFGSFLSLFCENVWPFCPCVCVCAPHRWIFVLPVDDEEVRICKLCQRPIYQVEFPKLKKQRSKINRGKHHVGVVGFIWLVGLTFSLSSKSNEKRQDWDVWFRNKQGSLRISRCGFLICSLCWTLTSIWF